MKFLEREREEMREKLNEREREINRFAYAERERERESRIGFWRVEIRIEWREFENRWNERTTSYWCKLLR